MRIVLRLWYTKKMKIFGWTIKNKKLKEKAVSSSDITGDTIESAYSRRAKEIESLRKYDRGEKEITPSNIRNLSKCV